MKLQEIFDAASVHLMGMDGPSLDENNDACVYRGYDDDCELSGKKCAVGLFIDDQHYSPDLEGQGITGSQSVADAVAASWGQDDLTVAQLMLLADLQSAHDQTSRGWDWSTDIVAALDGVATKFHLRFDPKGASA
mgnify:CR=1 FL=1